MFERFANFVLRQRLIWVISLAVITVVMGYFAQKAQLTYDNPKFIPDDDADYIAYQNFKKVFGEDGSVMVIGIETPKIHQYEFFGDWYNLTNDLKNNEGIERVLSLSNVPELLKQEKPMVYEGDTFYQEVLALNPVFQKAPESQLELDTLLRKVRNMKFYEGLLYTDSSDYTLIAITINKKLLDSYKRIEFVKTLQKKANALGKKHQLSIHYSGLPFIRTEMSNRIKEELKFFTVLSLIIAGLILLFFFRSFPTLVFSLLVVIIGVIWSLGFVVLFGYKITLFTGILPPLIVVIGIANCIYLLNKYHDEFRKHNNKMKALQRVISKIGMALLITNLTTAVGFGVFVLTGSKVLQEFGYVSFFSVMSVYIISLVLIPVIFSYLKSPSEKHTQHLENKYLNLIIDKIAFTVTTHRKWVYAGTILVVVFSVVGMLKVKTIGYMVDDIPEKDPLFKDLKFFEKNIKGVMPFEIVIDTKKDGGVKDPQVLSKIDALERKLGKFEEFSKPVSIAQLIKFARQANHDGDPRFYRVPGNLELGEIMNLLPNDNGDKSTIRGMVDSNYRKARVSVQMADVGSVRIKEIKKEVEQIADTIFPKEQYTVNITGTSVIFLKGNDYLISNLMQSLLVAFVLIAALMASIFSSARMIVISLIPNLVPLFFTAGIMGYFHVNLKPSTVLVFSVAFGIAVDYSIHFLSKYRMEMKKTQSDIKKSVNLALRETGTSMIYTAVVLFFGFIIFAFSNFGGTIALGVFTSLTLIVALVSNLMVLPSLLLSYDKAIQKKKNKQKPLIEYPDNEA